MTLRYPIGIQSFEKIIRESYAYMDESLMIKHLLDDGPGTFVITRSSRFGKSLNLSMINAFFGIRYRDNCLFSGLAISDHQDCMKNHGRYPTIYRTISAKNNDV